MSRSGYSDDCDDEWALIRWRGAVASAIRGKRGQAMLREMVLALDALPEKRLAAGELVTEGGDCCALGAVGLSRGLDMAPIDPHDLDSVAEAFNLTNALVAEIAYHNDEVIDKYSWAYVEICGPVRPYYPDYGDHVRRVRVSDTRADELRWQHMRDWAVTNINPSHPTP